jgi:hypothetical protein
MIVRHGALYGFNNIYRLEWFAIMYFILWHVSRDEAIESTAARGPAPVARSFSPIGRPARVT